MSATEPQSVAEQEQALAQTRLSESCDGVIAAVSGLSQAQWQFKPGPGRWSIADVVEHLAVIEGRVHLVLAKMETAPSAPPDRDVNKIDARILRVVPDRSHSTPAPERLLPTGRWTTDAALDEYREARRRTSAIAASSSCLRGRVIDHPVLGPLDGHQWLLTASAHSVRHTLQILEVKAAPDFPVG